MRVFVTGATGFIGRAVVRQLLDADHQVTGLARSEKSARTLTDLGAQAHVGSIEDLDGLRRGAAGANAAIHLAFFHSISHMSMPNRLRVLLGGSPSGIVSRFTATAVDVEIRAITALGSALSGPDRALVAAFPTMALTSGHVGTEDQPPDRDAPGGDRASTEEAVFSLIPQGIRASVVRLPPCVHDESRAGLVTSLTGIAKKKGYSAYIGDGQNHWAAVHRLDAAELFRLAVEVGEPGSRYHAVTEEGITFEEIAEAVAHRLGRSTLSLSPDKARKQFGWLFPFVAADNPVSSLLTRERIGWKPKRRGLLEDILEVSGSAVGG